MSGAAAATGSSVVKVPLAVCIRSVQAGVYPNVMQASSSIVRAAGVRGLFTVGCPPQQQAGLSNPAALAACAPLGKTAYLSVCLSTLGEGCTQGKAGGLYLLPRSVLSQLLVFLQGFLPTLLEDVPDMAVKFAVFETLKPLYARLTGGRPVRTCSGSLCPSSACARVPACPGCMPGLHAAGGATCPLPLRMTCNCLHLMLVLLSSSLLVASWLAASRHIWA